jgi:BolA protein|tara:strand:- start:318 stop:623 length:306 start_codon:yes stop_codon:yes gene_type:complete
MENRIRAKVSESLNPQELIIENESHKHGGPATDSHFKLTVVAADFEGLAAVKRHQRLYGILAQELKTSVHALALHLYSPSEWATNSASAPKSPDCRGGSSG